MKSKFKVGMFFRLALDAQKYEYSNITAGKIYKITNIDSWINFIDDYGQIEGVQADVCELIDVDRLLELMQSIKI